MRCQREQLVQRQAQRRRDVEARVERINRFDAALARGVVWIAITAFLVVVVIVLLR
jgi:hypothetical protein